MLTPKPAAGEATDGEPGVAGGGAGPPFGDAAADASGHAARGSVSMFLSQLAGLGLSTDALLGLFPTRDVDEVFEALARLGRVLRRRPVLGERLAFYLRGLRTRDPDERLAWLDALTDLRLHLSPSEETLAYLEEQDLTEELERATFARAGLAPPESADADRDPVAYARSLVTFLEMADTLLSGDANVALLLALLSRHGTLQHYYAAEATPRATVLRMAEAGFDVDHLVFGRSGVRTVGASEEKPSSWSEHMMEVLRRVLGTREEDPEVPVGPRPGKVFHQLKDDVERIREGDEEAGLRVVDEVLPRLEARYEQHRRNGHLRKASRVEEVVHDLRYLEGILTGDLERVTEPVRIRGQRSPQHVPELLFDNVRFACCLFKPSGLFHGEISRLLLDPATPMLEFWLDPYPDFLGLATLYAGVDARRRPTLFVDTVDYDDRLLELRGNRGTLRFMLDSLVVDASMAGAERLAVFAAPYGKPVNFANFVKEQAESLESASYRERYYFESVDPTDTALGASRTGERHYTVAFGYMRPLMGLISYGHNLVKPGRVLPYPEGGEGVVEIDVDAYLDEKELQDEVPEPDEPVATVDDAVIWRRPKWHEEELDRRRARTEARASERLDSLDPSLSLEVHAPPSPDLVEDLLTVDRAAFPASLRYDDDDLEERILYRDATALLVRSAEGEPVALALGYVSPTLGPDAFYLDDLAVVPEAQGTSIGTFLVDHLAELAMRAGFRRLYTLARVGAAERLRSFYAESGFTSVGTYGSLGTLLVRSLHVCDVVPGTRFEDLTREAEGSVSAEVDDVEISVRTSDDENLLALIQDLERVFPPEQRYTWAQLRERLLRPDAHVLVVEAGGEPVAFGLSYADPTLPRHALFLDSMSVRPSHQRQGIGAALFRLMRQIGALSHYTQAVFYCDDVGQAGMDLVEYYEAQGARHVDVVDGKNRMVADLRIADVLGDGDRAPGPSPGSETASPDDEAGDEGSDSAEDREEPPDDEDD